MKFEKVPAAIYKIRTATGHFVRSLHVRIYRLGDLYELQLHVIFTKQALHLQF